MKIVVVGAGAIGGYLAARLLEAGLDVTLLVREGRRKQLQAGGLVVNSPKGDYTGTPGLLVSGSQGGPFDLAVISCKAYGLPEVLADLKPYMHEQTAILPFLNGFKHMREIEAFYPGQPLLGGVARIEATLDGEGRIVHFGNYHQFAYGSFVNCPETLFEQIRSHLSSVPALVEKPDIKRELWEKYCFLSVLSGLTTLFQATVGEIRGTPDGMNWFRRAFAEAAEVIVRSGGKLGEQSAERYLQTIAGMSHSSTSSMLRDLEQGRPTEAEHIHGYLVELAQRHGVSAPILEAVHQRLVVYEYKRTNT